jgi:hypothetical protein
MKVSEFEFEILHLFKSKDKILFTRLLDKKSVSPISSGKNIHGTLSISKITN